MRRSPRWSIQLIRFSIEGKRSRRLAMMLRMTSELPPEIVRARDQSQASTRRWASGATSSGTGKCSVTSSAPYERMALYVSE